jgi:hypothetical protein
MNSRDVRVKWVATALICAVAFGLAALPALAADQPVEIHGWMLNRIYAEPGSLHLQAERISLSAAKDVDKDVKAYVEWYYHYWQNLKPSLGSPWFLDSAYANYTDKCGNQLRFGVGRNYCFGIVPSYGNRKHSEYGLIAETFTQDRIIGLQYFGSTRDKKLDFGVAVHNSDLLGTRFSGTDQAFFRDDDTVPHLADKGQGRNLAVSGRVALPVVKGGKLGASYRYGTLQIGDLSFLVSKGLVSATATSRTNNRWGGDFNYKSPQGIVAQAEYYGAKTSDLDFSGWDVLVGLEPANPMALKYYARYGQLDLEPPAVTSSTYTWNQQQLILSIVKPLLRKKPVWLQLEYINNQESPPAGIHNVADDVLFLELFTGF